jgi:hypothetical protein
MSLLTPFSPDNSPTAIHNFGWYKIERHTKDALENILKSFYAHTKNKFVVQIPEIAAYQSSPTDEDESNSNLTVMRDFPFESRKFPMVLIVLKDINENKMYIGNDNVIGYTSYTTSTGTTAVEICAGSAKMTATLIILARSSEERMKISESLFMCFTHYYRWQYFFTYGDGNTFSIVPTTEQIRMGTEVNAKDGTEEASISLVYMKDVNLFPYVEYTFRGTDIYGMQTEVAYDEDSGPIEE